MSQDEGPKLKDAAQKRGYGLPSWMSIVGAMKVAAHIPNWAWRPIVRFSGWLAVWRGYRAARQWRLNAGVIMGRTPTNAEARAGMRSWLWNLAMGVRLGKLSTRQILQMVRVDDESQRLVRESWANGGAVIALPHVGDWDMSGAWACAVGMPVSAVAERLPDEEFEYFMKVRQRLGMTIYSHKQQDTIGTLAEDLKAGHLVALVSDRDLSRHSVPVVWQTASGPQNVSMPPGPAVLARKTGASLLIATSKYTRRGIDLHFMGPVEVDMGDDGVAVTTQRIADYFARLVADNPIDWHLMQRFFPDLVAE